MREVHYEREPGNVDTILLRNNGFPVVLRSALTTLPDESLIPGATPVGLGFRFLFRKFQ
jgi:hypothetical protein